MDNTTLEKLHYHELKEIVKGYCASGLGKALIDKLEPSINIDVVNRRLDETSEGRTLLDASYHIPFDGIFNVKPLIEKIEKGASLAPEDLSMMENFLRGSRKLKLFMKGKEGYAPTLSSYSLNITDLSYIEEEINTSISGNRVASNASKELKKIRKRIDICEDQIKKRLEKFLENPVNKEYIQEFFVSQRNGKYTVPIKTAFKNKVQGKIVETSLKGSTVFVEPDVVARYASELSELRIEETLEEYKNISYLNRNAI